MMKHRPLMIVKGMRANLTSSMRALTDRARVVKMRGTSSLRKLRSARSTQRTLQ